MLVALFDPRAPASESTVAAIERLSADTLLTPVFCLGEFWRVTTEVRGLGHPASAAEAFLRSWTGRATPIAPGLTYTDTLLRLLREVRPRGAEVFDVQIAAVCIENEVDVLWTLDPAIFQRAGLATYDPRTP